MMVILNKSSASFLSERSVLKMFKKKIIRGLILSFVVTLLFVGNAFSAEQNKRTENLQSLVLEDFELGQDGKAKRQWIAIPDRFGRKGNLESGDSLQQLSWINSWPEAYFGRDGKLTQGNDVKEYKTSLAVKIAFNRQGYNSVELFPLENKDGKLIKSPIPFIGIVKQMDLWIWGANYNYYIEAVFKDYKGVEHRLPVGSIQHVGWKNFILPIPNYIPQSGTYVLGQYQFSLVKLIIWTTPEEKVNGTYVYIDHIKYLSDIFDSKYDGYELGKTDAVNNLWEKAPKAPTEKEIVQ
jgi:hypothetical protein